MTKLPIKQEDKLGCAIACAAFLLNINYQDSLKLFKNGKYKAKNKGFFCKDIIIVLKKAGLKYEYRYIKNKIRRKIYKPNTFVYIKKSKKYPQGHYLVRFDNKWMDPWINFPDENIKAGYRKRLPERPIYAILALTK